MKQPSEKQAQKKPYQPPKLLVYGDLTQMTQTTSSRGALDGGGRIGKRRTGR